MSDHNRSIVRREAVSAVEPYPVLETSYSIATDTAVVARQGWTALRRRWRLAVGIFVLVVSTVAGVTMLRPASFRATGLLEIRPENADAVPVATLFGPQRVVGESLATQFGLLQSVTLAERVVAEGHFDGADAGWRLRLPGLSWLSSGAGDAASKIERLREGLTVSPQEGSRLVRIDFDDGDPRRAADVVNSVLKNYLGLRIEEAERTAAWLTTQRDDGRRVHFLEGGLPGGIAVENGREIPFVARVDLIARLGS
jgi:uncharacterized protein involved in exopolysaccharide biosynthesis